MKRKIWILAYLISVLFLSVQTVSAQSTEFTYQGSLKTSGSAANGNHDFQFALFDAASGGNQTSSIITLNNVVVTDGIFSVQLNFGAAFPGANRFLEIRVRQTGGGAFTTLAPRQLVTGTPTAINSLQLGGLTANQFVLTGDARLSDARNPLPNSANYIQNTTAQQATSNFNISGGGTAGGTLSGNIVNAATQYNLGGNRILIAGGGNLFAGFSAGINNSSGFQNSFFGSGAGQNNTVGINNSFFGQGAGSLNLTGSNNSFFGKNAGGNVTFSGAISLFGALSDSADGLTNATAIGFRAFVTQSDSLVLGSIFNVNGAPADTSVGIGTTAPLKHLHIRGAGDQEIMIESSDTGGIRWTLQSSDGASGGRFEIIDRTNGASRLTILDDGSVGIGTTAPADRLQVNGIIRVNTLGSAGSTSICRNGNNQISTCSSSIRYKTNINSFTSGLSLIKKLRPVTFNWKADNREDFGLVAEEVAKVSPLLVTLNENGKIEGVKYDRVGVVLLNAVNEQQTQIEQQQKQIDGQKQANSDLQKQIDEQAAIIKSQQKTLENQKSEFEALKKFVCAQNPTAALCQPEQ